MRWVVGLDGCATPGPGTANNNPRALPSSLTAAYRGLLLRMLRSSFVTSGFAGGFSALTMGRMTMGAEVER